MNFFAEFVNLVNDLSARLMQKPALLGKILILLATVIWGSSFVVLKNTLDTIPTEYLLGFRFSLAAVLLAGVFYPMLRKFNLGYLRRGLLLGGAAVLRLLHPNPGADRHHPGQKRVPHRHLLRHRAVFLLGD